MSEEYRYPRSLLSLPVAGSPTPSLGTPEEDKGEGLPPSPSQQSLIDRAVDTQKTPDQKRIEEKVIDVIRTIYDPEIPVNIYDLGLIYAIHVHPETHAVTVDMTLTAPACPVAETLPPMVANKIETLAEVPTARVELVWDPPWNRSMMSEAAQLELGLI